MIEYQYAVSTGEELQAYQSFLERHREKLEAYQQYLERECAVEEWPAYIIWSNKEMATKVFRDISVPAYTNDFRMVMTPETAVWRDLYLAQLAVYDETDSRVQALKQHYESISEAYLLQIVGHELAHNSEWFLENGWEKGIWFEEGMVEYISRRYFLSAEEYQAEKEANQLLVNLFEEKYGLASLEAFGQETYDGSYAAIFCEYWRSFLLVDELVTAAGDLASVFARYHEWGDSDQTQTLSQWFGLEVL